MSFEPELLGTLKGQALGRRLDVTRLDRELGELRGWEARFRYLIQLGRELAPLPEAVRTDAHRVAGCESRVWLVLARDPDSGRIYVGGDSEARIVRGLIALVVAAVNGQRAEAIRAFDMEAWFARLDLLTHLSPSRGNGLRAIVEEIRDEVS